MVRVQCPHCQRRYRTEIGAFGRTAVCTKCSQSFRIGESRPPFQWQHTELAEDSWIGVPPPEEKQEMKHCIICDAPLRPETFRCPECGANQVTGVVHRSRPVHRGPETSIWSAIPVRAILVVLAVALVGAGVFWTFKTLTRKTAEMGEELADTTLVARVSRELREGADESDLARRYAGQVTDENLERFMASLSAESPSVRRAAALLIGAGRITRIEPLLKAADSPDARTSEPAAAALDAIGPRRLAELSCDPNESVRAAAARALQSLFDLDPVNPRVARLAAAMPIVEKTALLNELCRPWPYLVGLFVARMGEEVSPFTLSIEQVGKVFYMRIAAEEFRTRGDSRRFEIPIHRWCAATGAAVDVRSVKELLGGSVELDGSTGVQWTGTIAWTARRKLTGPVPGFIPRTVPEPGKTLTAPLSLERAPR